MKKIILAFIILMPFVGSTQESYGNTLNIGLGLSHSYKSSFPSVHFNYEIDVAKNFTLAPFVSLYHYRTIYKGNSFNYKYNSTIVPIGVRGFYYFDDLFNLIPQFDIYGGASIGFNLISGGWSNDYPGENYNDGISSLYLGINIGAEYHINDKVGLVLDLSSKYNSFGIAVHL